MKEATGTDGCREGIGKNTINPAAKAQQTARISTSKQFSLKIQQSHTTGQVWILALPLTGRVTLSRLSSLPCGRPSLPTWELRRVPQHRWNLRAAPLPWPSIRPSGQLSRAPVQSCPLLCLCCTRPLQGLPTKPWLPGAGLCLGHV